MIFWSFLWTDCVKSLTRSQELQEYCGRSLKPDSGTPHRWFSSEDALARIGNWYLYGRILVLCFATVRKSLLAPLDILIKDLGGSNN
jgi:hypothetical protein